MATVKIYSVTCTKAVIASQEIGTGYSLEPWGNNTMDFEGSDDGGNDYVLPDGFTLGTSNDGGQHIYDKNGKYCELFTSRIFHYDRPAIMTDNGPVILEPVENFCGIRIG